MFTTDATGRLYLYMIDFEHASFLPVSFLAFAVLTYRRWWNTEHLAKRIGHTFPTSNLEALEHAWIVFGPSSASVGLRRNENGPGWSLNG